MIEIARGEDQLAGLAAGAGAGGMDDLADARRPRRHHDPPVDGSGSASRKAKLSRLLVGLAVDRVGDLDLDHGARRHRAAAALPAAGAAAGASGRHRRSGAICACAAAGRGQQRQRGYRRQCESA